MPLHPPGGFNALLKEWAISSAYLLGIAIRSTYWGGGVLSELVYVSNELLRAFRNGLTAQAPPLRLMEPIPELPLWAPPLLTSHASNTETEFPSTGGSQRTVV